MAEGRVRATTAYRPARARKRFIGLLVGRAVASDAVARRRTTGLSALISDRLELARILSGAQAHNPDQSQ